VQPFRAGTETPKGWTRGLTAKRAGTRRYRANFALAEPMWRGRPSPQRQSARRRDESRPCKLKSSRHTSPSDRLR
jgi:hypothetical protein